MVAASEFSNNTWSTSTSPEKEAQCGLAIQRPGITVCKDDQGLAVDLALEADTAQMHRCLIGHMPFRDLLTCGDARFLGPSRLAKAFPTWFDTALFSHDLSTPEAPEYPSYSQAVKVGNTIYVAGTVGVDVATGELAGPTIQTRPASRCSTVRRSCGLWRRTERRRHGPHPAPATPRR